MTGDDGRLARLRMHALRLWSSDLAAPADVVRQLVAMQAQEHRYARWSIAQRTEPGARASAVDRAYDEGRIVRTHLLRPTWHYVAPGDLRWLVALSGPRVDARNARRYTELDLDTRTLARATDVIAVAVDDEPRTRAELAEILDGRGIASTGQRLPYLLMRAELVGAICSGPMRGRHHSYVAFDDRVPAAPGPRGDDALAELARRYFETRGPAVLQDFVWWSGLSTADARRGLEGAAAHLASEEVDGRTYWLANHSGATAEPAPRVDLVQCYDEVIISYRATRDVLAHPEAAFPVPATVAGLTHVLLLDGQLLGHWRSVEGRGGLRVETRPARPLESGEQDALAAAVERYRRFHDT